MEEICVSECVGARGLSEFEKHFTLFFFCKCEKKHCCHCYGFFLHLGFIFRCTCLFFFFFCGSWWGFHTASLQPGEKKANAKKKTKTSAHQITLTFNFNKDHLLQSVTCSSPFTAISLHVPNSSISLKLMSKATEIIKQRSGIWRTVMASGQLLLPHLLASP